MKIKKLEKILSESLELMIYINYADLCKFTAASCFAAR
jgi:hypothetical protein